MSSKNYLLLSKISDYDRFEFMCDEMHLNDTIRSIMNVLYFAAQGNNLFVEYFGQNPDLESSKNVICRINDVRNVFKKKFWLNESWLITSDISFADEYYTALYIFDHAFSWIDFLEIATSRFKSILKIPQLQVLALFGDCQFPNLFVKQGNTIADKITYHFKENGFDIRRRYFCV